MDGEAERDAYVCVICDYLYTFVCMWIFGSVTVLVSVS